MFVSYPSHRNPATTKKPVSRGLWQITFFVCAFFLWASSGCKHANLQRKELTKTTPIAKKTVRPASSNSAHFCQQCPTPDLACKPPWQRLQRHTQQFLQPATQLPHRIQQWQVLLVHLKEASSCLSPNALSAYRHLLEVKSDHDRNHHPRFPTGLSHKIIQAIVKLDLQRQAPHLAQKPKSAKTSKFVPVLYSDVNNAQAKGDASETDSRPALVFTDRDIERFREPTTFLRWPARGALSSGFGLRTDPFQKKRRFHQGLDIAAPFGSPVYAASHGTVRHTGWMGSCGLGILIQHARGFRTLYCHLSQILIGPNDAVTSGQYIGRIGSTGRSTGPHLHFGLFLHKHPINPRPYLPRKHP